MTYFKCLGLSPVSLPVTSVHPPTSDPTSILITPDLFYTLYYSFPFQFGITSLPVLFHIHFKCTLKAKPKIFFPSNAR